MDINAVLDNWTNVKWQNITATQKERDGPHKGDYITAGTTGQSDTARFQFLHDTSTNALLQKNPAWKSLIKVMAATVFLPVYLGTAVVGNAVGIAEAFVSLRKNGIKDLEVPSRLTDRLWSNFMPIFKGVFAYKVVTSLYSWDFEVLGRNFFTTLATAAWATYLFYNPNGAAVTLSQVEELLGAEQLPECRAAVPKNYTLAKNWREMFDGSIPLTYWFGIKSPGNLLDEVDGKKVFEIS